MEFHAVHKVRFASAEVVGDPQDVLAVGRKSVAEIAVRPAGIVAAGAAGVSEFRRFAGSTVEAHVGEIIPFEDLKNTDNRRALIDELFQHVLMLGSQDAVTDTYEPGGGLRAALSRDAVAG